jgi:hypothetical protein
MTTAELLAKLRSLNVNIWVDKSDLGCNGPQGALTAELRATSRPCSTLARLCKRSRLFHMGFVRMPKAAYA